MKMSWTLQEESLLFDSYLSVCWWARVRQSRGLSPGREAGFSAAASLTHARQGSVEIGLMNRGERETAGLLFFQYKPHHYQFNQRSSAQHRAKGQTVRSVGGISGPAEKRTSDNRLDMCNTMQLLLMCHSQFLMEILVTLYVYDSLR